VATGRVTISNGAYQMHVDGSADESDKARRAMKTLIMSPYFGLTAFQLDTITRVRPSQKCFETIP
jgi:hypothetical protein